MNVISIGDTYGHAWRALWANFLPLFVIGLLALILLAPASIMAEMAAKADGFMFLYYGTSALFCHVLFRGPIEYGVKYVYLRAVKEQFIEIKHLLEGFRNYLNVIVANLLVALIVGVGLMLFVIPGIIFACKLAFVPYLVVDSQMDAWDAVQESWSMTSGCTWQIFCVGLLAIPVCIAGLLCFGAGIIISIMWVRLAFAAIYDAVDTLEEREELAVFG